MKVIEQVANAVRGIACLNTKIKKITELSNEIKNLTNGKSKPAHCS